MAIKNIPTLPADYPLFGWSGHEESKDALIPGGLVENFKKEAWNAMVEAVEDALSESGLIWDDTILSADSLIMTQPYTALSADMFNALAQNISRAAPIGDWAWARDRNFRGYIGRNDFIGYDEHGMNGNPVYPEYLEELARRIDLLIEIMRDTAPFCNALVSFTSKTEIKENFIQRKSAPIQIGKISESSENSEAFACLSAPAQHYHLLKSMYEAEASSGKSSATEFEEIIKTIYFSAAKKLIAKKSEYSELLTTQNFAFASMATMLHILVHVFSKSRENAFLKTALSGKIEHDGISISQKNAVANSFKSDIIRGESIAESLGTGQNNLAKSSIMQFSERISSKSCADLVSIWYPALIDGSSLFVRSVYSADQNGEILEVS